MKVISKNKRAYFEYHILDTYTAGIQLRGSEVKSIKNGDLNLNEAYVFIEKGEIFIRNMHVSEHKQGGRANNHDPLRIRKLLLNKKEITTLNDKVKQKGLTIVPLSIILTDIGFIKIEIGLAKGKKIYDKKEAIKEKDMKRDLERNL
jgi:SsrA-binding protein